MFDVCFLGQQDQVSSAPQSEPPAAPPTFHHSPATHDLLSLRCLSLWQNIVVKDTTLFWEVSVCHLPLWVLEVRQ